MLCGIYNFGRNDFLVLDIDYSLKILRDLVGRDNVIKDLGMSWWSGDTIVEVPAVLNFQKFDKLGFAGFREEDLAEIDEHAGVVI